MKKWKSKLLAGLISFCMAFVFIAADFIAAPATVQAANGLKFAKSITIMKGTETDYGIFNSVKSDKILNLKSSNTNVATVKKGKFINDHSITVKAKKQGTTIVSFTIQRKNGKRYSFKSKISVFNYTNPLSKCVFGKTDYTKQFDKENFTYISPDSAKKGKINITLKKGYTLKGLYCVEYGSGIRKKLKNGNVITLDGMHYILIEYKNVSKNYSYATFLFGK